MKLNLIVSNEAQDRLIASVFRSLPDSPFNDVTLVCSDGHLKVNGLALALLLPVPYRTLQLGEGALLLLPDHKVQELVMRVGKGVQDQEYSQKLQVKQEQEQNQEKEVEQELEQTILMEGSGFLKKWNQTIEREHNNVMNKPSKNIQHSFNQFSSDDNEESEAISSSKWQTSADCYSYDNNDDIERSVTGHNTILDPPSIPLKGPLSVLVENPPPPPAHLFPAFLKGPLSVLAKSDVTWMLRRILHVFHPGSFGKGRNIWWDEPVSCSLLTSPISRSLVSGMEMFSPGDFLPWPAMYLPSMFHSGPRADSGVFLRPCKWTYFKILLLEHCCILAGVDCQQDGRGQSSELFR